jgi:hypothetical protein
MKNTNTLLRNIKLSNKLKLIKYRELFSASILLSTKKNKLNKLKKSFINNKRPISFTNNSLSLLNLTISNNNINESMNSDKLTPWQITGLVDGEGSFTCSAPLNGLGVRSASVKLEFKVTQKEDSEKILHKLTDYFGCGSVVIDNKKTATKKFRVSSIKDILEIIIPHFDLYPCLTSKFLNFNDWKLIAMKISKKEHLTSKGLIEIKSIIGNMNKERSFEDKYNFCKNSLGLTINGEITKNLPAEWVQTFLAGEATFYNYLPKQTIDNRGKPYQRCDSSLEIAQNSHDVIILLAIKKFFGGGYIKPKYNICDIIECKNSRSVNRYIFRDTKAIINFVDNYPMLNRKHLDYLDWKKIVELKNNGSHNTIEGLELMKKIISNMNSTRNPDTKE